MPTVVLLGTLDTKGTEYAFVRDRLLAAGVDVVVVDAGVLSGPSPAEGSGGAPLAADVSAAEVAAAGGADLAALAAARDRGAAVTAMARGAAEVLGRLHQQESCAGALALGGTGGTSIAAQAFRELPLGVPKVIVSTAASGDTRAYVAESDLVLFPSVTDVAGVNRLSARILANAAAALAGMVTAPEPEVAAERPLLAASMFGVTTPCVTAARDLLEKGGYEVLVFHMTGVGGRTLEGLAADGWLAGILDATTTELADELVGGVFSAGPGRLTAAAAAGVPQVVSVGALDMVNFGPKETVPEKFADRNLYVHNPSVTLMRTTPEECAELGTRLATRVSASTGPAAVFLPLKGISAIAGEGGPFHDADADAALFDAISSTLDRSRVELIELDLDVNDPAFAAAMVEKLDAYVTGSTGSTGSTGETA